MNPRSILVYTDGEVIGDGVIRLPFAAALKQAFPNATLTWLASGYSVYTNVLKELSDLYIDEVVVIPHRDMPFTDFLLGPAPLRGRKFDLIIDAQRKVKRTLWLKRIAHRMFMSAAANYLLSSRRLPQNHPRFIDQITALAEAATGTKLTLPPLPVAPPYHEAARRVLPDGETYVGFIVGAGHPDKCWPLERFIAIARNQQAQGRVPVIFLGPKEQELAQTLRAELPTAIFPLMAEGDIITASPCFTIALGARLRAAVANDSGGGHLLAAGGCNLVSLFRSATVRRKFLPTAPRVIALAPEDYNGSSMSIIPLEAAEKALNSIIKSRI